MLYWRSMTEAARGERDALIAIDARARAFPMSSGRC
jgi:hypothetical protein